ncbi:hypothetical protein JOB18_021914 [Solea senegalensis]|uniref:Uncharacterized protein n=1 Tax=Solea senegalensis TaxID=28829 RepID=A0AAV6Q3N5_SOLSE|nr:hypothetical protein JOB18_021914 [Solea senegalensis]
MGATAPPLVSQEDTGAAAQRPGDVHALQVMTVICRKQPCRTLCCHSPRLMSAVFAAAAAAAAATQRGEKTSPGDQNQRARAHAADVGCYFIHLHLD